MNILQAFDDPKLFGRAIPKGQWEPWRAFLAALFALGLDDDAQAVFAACTGRTKAPASPFSEAHVICGRRAGKSFVLALIATFLACFKSYQEHLGPGERATVMVIASDRRQARVIFRYIRGLLQAVPMLSRLVEGETAETISLTNRVNIEVVTASHRVTRGYTIAAALCDEIAFWGGDESASPDTEILNALRPGMGTIPGAMLLCASSPYAKRGALWNAYRRHYGKDTAPVLVWKAPTRTMNPSFPQETIDAALQEDPSAAAAEYLAEFRNDVEAFVDREVVEMAVEKDVIERAPLSGVHYRAFVDPSGGASDSMTLAIAHDDGKRSILDAVRERKAPFNPESVVDEFATLLKRYGVWKVKGDRYAGEWPREVFRRHGIEYWTADLPKSQIYINLLPRLNSGEVDLLDVPVLVNQLAHLERRTARSGKDSIDHAPNSHDDVANAVAGVLTDGLRSLPGLVVGRYSLSGYGHRGSASAAPEDWRKRGDRYPPGDPRWKAWERERQEIMDNAAKFGRAVSPALFAKAQR